MQGQQNDWDKSEDDQVTVSKLNLNGFWLEEMTLLVDQGFSMLEGLLGFEDKGMVEYVAVGIHVSVITFI